MMNIKFDTRSKKPKLYHLAVLAVLTVAALIWLLAVESPERLQLANILLAVFFGLMILCLINALIGQLEYNPYSYNTIIYSGFMFFNLSQLITHVRAALLSMSVPEVFSRRAVLATLLNSARTYMRLTAPFLFAFSAALFISNLSLIRHEGRRFVNILGIILSILLIGGEVGIYILDRIAGGDFPLLGVSGRGRISYLFLRAFVSLSAALYLYFECMMIGTVIAFAVTALYTPDPDREYLIILGCGLMEDGTPTPLLKGRVDLALNFYHRQRQKTGREAKFVASGGQGPDEVQSEAASMRDYLLSKGIPADRILLEDKSGDTAENMRFSRDRILEDAAADRQASRADGPDAAGSRQTSRAETGTGADPNLPAEGYPTTGPLSKVAFFTTNYHVFRAGLKGRRVHMRVQGMGAPTRWYFWPNAAVREFVGLLTEHRLKQGALLGGLVLAYTVLAVLV